MKLFMSIINFFFPLCFWLLCRLRASEVWRRVGPYIRMQLLYFTFFIYVSVWRKVPFGAPVYVFVCLFTCAHFIYILGICVSFLASYMCTVGQGLDRKQEYIIYSGFIQIDTLGGGHIMEDIARREWPVSL